MTTDSGSRLAVAGGAVGSVALMLYAGRTNTHLLITLLFVVWVLAPFAVLQWALGRSVGWAPRTRTTLHVLTPLIAVASLAIYAYRAMFPPRSTGAFLFVITPPVAVGLLVIALAVASWLSPPRPSRKESL